MKNIDLKDLIIKTLAGDQLACEQFLSALLPKINARIYNKIQKNEDLNDVKQNALMAIYKSLKTFDVSREINPWVNAIIDFKIADYYRKKSRVHDKEINIENKNVTIPGQEPNIDFEMIDMIEQLPEKFIQPIVLTKIKGHSTKEAAEILNIKENALRTRVSRGIQKLEVLMKELK